MIKSENKELKLVEKAAREFSKKILAPGREENDAFPFGPFFNDVLDKAYALDLFHIQLPEHLGGMGHGIRVFCTIMDQICQEDSSLGGIIFTNALAQSVMLASGSEALLKSIAEQSQAVPDFLVAFSSLANPNDISDLPTAQSLDGGYFVSGALNYLVLGGIAKQAVVPARISPGAPYSYFLVDLNGGDVIRSEPVMSHGLHACPAVDATFSSAKGILLGIPGKGDSYFKKGFETLQLVAAAMSAGVMKGSLQEAIAYCNKRVQGGRKLKDWSTMQMMLADMTIQTYVADMLIARACQAVENRENDWQIMVQAASLHIQAAATHLVSDGIQALGGVGYMKDFGQEKRFRDAGQIQALLGHAHLKKLRFIRQFLHIGKGAGEAADLKPVIEVNVKEGGKRLTEGLLQAATLQAK